jgi:hypothetical protein
VSLWGVSLYRLSQQYALAADGQSVHVRGCERSGPFGIAGTHLKSHSGRIGSGGKTASYRIPIYATEWRGEYTIGRDPNGVDSVHSVLTCAWGETTESIRRTSRLEPSLDPALTPTIVSASS